MKGDDGLAQGELSRIEIISQARSLGAEFVGFAPVGRWEEYGDVPAAFHPHRIWPPAATVIVLGVPIRLPFGDASSTVLGREQFRVTNDLLDEAAYRLAVWLNGNGHQAINIPRDSNGENIADYKPVEVFSHAWAGHYAGIGRVDRNGTFVAGEGGFQLNLVSILTALPLEGDATD